MSEGSGSQRYCGNCGTEIRAGTSFCVSCGASLASGSTGSKSANSEPSRSEQTASPTHGASWASVQGFVQRVRESFAGSYRSDFQQASNRTIRWFESLPVALKIAVVGISALVLLVLLSPLALLAAALLLGVSIIALLIRVAQRGEIKGWGLTAVASLVLVFLFGGISDAVYGIGLPGGSDSGSEVASESLSDSAPNDAGYDPSNNPAFSGVDMSYIAWEFDVTCEQLDGNDELADKVALELADTINSPLGTQAAIDSVRRHLVTECVGVDPQFAPGSNAERAASDEVGDY